MNISILGNGSVGRSLGTLLAQKGITVHLGARSHEGRDYVEGVLPSTLEEASHASEIVACALPWSIDDERVSLKILKSLDLSGRIVIDMTNPLKSDWSPVLLGEENSAGQETARALPECRVVKAFNTVFADMMDRSRLDAFAVKPAGLYCGEDTDAKSQVESLISLVGLEPIDAGGIAAAHSLEQLAHLNIRLALSREKGTHAAFAYLRS